MSAISHLVRDPAFALAFRVREPVSARPDALLLLLHGVGGNEHNLADLAERVSPGTLVVLPRAPLELGEDQFAWFRVAFTTDGPRIAAHEAEQSRATLVRFIAQLQAAYAIPPDRTTVAGFSQGGILSASVALTAPEQTRGFAVLCGRILPELEPRLAARERLAHLAGFIAHGREDTKLPVEWAQRADAWLTGLGVPHETLLFSGGHGIPSAVADAFLDWHRNTALQPCKRA